MKIQTKKELHAKSIAELSRQLKEARDEQRALKLDREMGKLKNTSSLTSKRVEIAVIRTIINEKLVEAKILAIVKPEDKKEVLTKVKPAVKAKESKKVKAKSAIKKTASVKTTAVKPVRQAQGKGGKK